LLQALVGGLLEALAMLSLVALGLMATGQAQWRGAIEIGTVLNALALLVGVGFAEELLFRGWLWGELQLGMGQRRALWLQAAVFSLVHPWMSVPGLGALGLLGGVFLLGVVLALQRRSDGGLLWGAVGLHGGLVGGWFVLQSGLLELSPQATAWLAGPGGARPNPIGGLLGILALGGLYLLLRKQSQGMA
jgi:membrane protease YdiL (CAAX protease family)